MKDFLTSTANFARSMAIQTFIILLASAVVTPIYNMVAWDFNFHQYGYVNVVLILLGLRMAFKSITGTIED